MMGLFGFGKKKEEEKQVPTCCCGGSNAPAEEASGCCCGGSNAPVEEASGCCCGAADQAGGSACCGAAGSGIASIKVLGAGCKSCHEQYENALAAVKAMGLNVEVEYITDLEKVMGYGVMSMPAIVVNEQVVSMGKVLKAAQVEKLLQKLGL